MATPSLRPIRNDAFDYWAAQHLLNRAGFGGTPAQIRALADMGLSAAVDYIVNYDRVAATAVRADDFDGEVMVPATDAQRQQLRQARRQGKEVVLEQFRQERQRRQRRDRQQIREMQTWWLRRIIETGRPLEEKMTLFWHGHFATGYRTIENSYHMFLQNQMFRRNATDSFASLAFGIIRDPAMLRYLNNNQSNRRRPNENLARELMELFTLGEGNGYTERDIKEGARALTGYTFYGNEFAFRPNLHDPEPKRILGKTADDGEDFVRIILQRNEPSQFITWKLYRYFVNDRPGDPDTNTKKVVIELAKRFKSSGYQIRPMLERLFKSEHFYDPENRASLIKHPVQLLVQAVRSLNTPVRSLPALVNATDLMGQNLFFPPSVKGWDGGRAWINTSTLFVRQNALVYLLTGQRPDALPWEADGQPYDASHLIDHLQSAAGTAEPRTVVEYLLRFTLGRPASPARVETLTEFVDSHGGRIHNDMLVALLSLITAMPEYQLC